MDKIDPCFICGGYVEIEEYSGPQTIGEDRSLFVIKCHRCNEETSENSTKQEAIDEWNSLF